MLGLLRAGGIDLLKRRSERTRVAFSSLRASTVEVVDGAGANDEDGSSMSTPADLGCPVAMCEASDSVVSSSREEGAAGSLLVSVLARTCEGCGVGDGTGNGVTVWGLSASPFSRADKKSQRFNTLA